MAAVLITSGGGAGASLISSELSVPLAVSCARLVSSLQKFPGVILINAVGEDVTGIYLYFSEYHLQITDICILNSF